MEHILIQNMKFRWIRQARRDRETEGKQEGLALPFAPHTNWFYIRILKEFNVNFESVSQCGLKTNPEKRWKLDFNEWIEGKDSERRRVAPQSWPCGRNDPPTRNHQIDLAEGENWSSSGSEIDILQASQTTVIILLLFIYLFIINFFILN